VAGVPVQPLAEGVMVMVAVIGPELALVAVNDGMFPDPLAARPMAVLLFVQVNVVPLTGPDKVVAVTLAPLQCVWFDTFDTVGVGFTVIL
jgi:hypothetical protein